MKRIVFLLLFIVVICYADTPPPGALSIKGATNGTLIGNTGNALNVNVSGGTISGTVNQGTSGSDLSPWFVDITNIPGVTVTNFPSNQSVTILNPNTNYSLESGGNLSSILVNQTNGNQLTQVTNFPSNQTINGTVSVSNFPSSTIVTQSTAADLNATVVGTVTANAGTGTFQTNITNSSIPVTESGTWNVGLNTGSNNIGSITNITGTIPLATNAATASNQSNIITTLGSPFQAGGNIGNTSFGSTQSGTWNINNISGTISLPTDASTASNQTNVQSTIGTSASTAITIQGSSSGVAIPISGTITATVSDVSTATNQTNGNQLTQIVNPSGTPVQVTVSNALKVDGSAVTQPISAVNLPLATNASTASNQISQITQETTTATNTTNILANQTNGSQISQVSSTVTPNDFDVFGSITTTCSTPTASCPVGSVVLVPIHGAASSRFNITGTFTGASLNIDCTLDGINWNALRVAGGANASYQSTAITATGNFRIFRLAACEQIRLRASALVSGTVNTEINVSGPPDIIESVAAGRTSITTTRNVYSSTNVTTSAYVTLIASTTSPTTKLNVFDSSGQTLYLSYAATCGALSSTVNTIIIPPGGMGDMDWAIPSGQCLGIIAISANATAGEFDATFLQ
jgi:hypothetical protein